jgi:hypothetical protein
LVFVAVDFFDPLVAGPDGRISTRFHFWASVSLCCSYCITSIDYIYYRVKYTYTYAYYLCVKVFFIE